MFGAALILGFGPLSFLGHNYPQVSDRWDDVFVIGVLALPMMILMSAHIMRPNLIGVILTSLGTALWYLAGFAAGLARIP